MSAPQLRRAFTISLPATIGNVGPGFDCFGLAVSLRNTFSFHEETQGGLHLGTVTGSLSPLPELPDDAQNMVFQAFLQACEYWEWPVPEHCRLDMDLHIPLDGGLGSSATAHCAGLLAAWAWNKPSKVRMEHLARLAIDREGHPDNALPCLFGGFVVIASQRAGELPRFLRVEVRNAPALGLCVADKLKISTDKARSVIPQSVSVEDAVYNVSRASLIALAFSQGPLAVLGWPDILNDRLHQPWRGPLIPGFEDIQAAVADSAAYGVLIAGSGPTLLLLGEDEDSVEKAGQRVLGLWREHAVEGRFLKTQIENAGPIYSGL